MSLFIAAHRGHLRLCEKLINSGKFIYTIKRYIDTVTIVINIFFGISHIYVINLTYFSKRSVFKEMGPFTLICVVSLYMPHAPIMYCIAVNMHIFENYFKIWFCLKEGI